MEVSNIVSLFGGIALFLFGMSVMGDSLKKLAGSKMEMILFKLAGNPVKGIVLGTGVTAVIQSSSATSVMVVGFVNSGMMKVRQAIGIILGAILGTSITGWILCLNSLGGSGASVASFFSTEILTGIVAFIGIALWMFSKKNVRKNIGGIMMGFAVLMYGMSMMSAAISPLREDENFIRLLMSFRNPILGVLVGLLITAVIQSASAAVGILQALAMTGAVEFDMAFPIIMGIGIGASVPVMLSALGAGTNGKRTAFVYLIIDVLGAVLCGCIFYLLDAIIGFPFMNHTMNMVSVAFVNTMYRLATVILLSPMIGILEKIVCALFPEGAEAQAEREDMDRLESRFLQHPTLALAQSKTVIDSMAAKVQESVLYAVKVRRGEENTTDRVFELEEVIDRYEDKLGAYLFSITSRDLNEEQSNEVSKYLRVLSDFERMSD
ncbi:MAG: Na/Pi cotransporter family protein, partial [Firmicutes bacterium]|nr:Na/Pi cotransporter family protein [Bacillota bacterium]